MIDAAVAAGANGVGRLQFSVAKQDEMVRSAVARVLPELPEPRSESVPIGRCGAQATSAERAMMRARLSRDGAGGQKAEATRCSFLRQNSGGAASTPRANGRR